ncbi:MAG TPA: prolyl oligopeptidase family serine peptidase, partial [Bryobacteraceae bacterium]
QVAYVIAGEVWIGAARAGSTPKAISMGNLPTWSDNSGRVAFYSSQSGSLQVWIWDAGSGKITQVTNVLGGISPDPRTRQSGSVNDILRMSWSPDGEKLAFASRVESSITRAAGARPEWQPADAVTGRPLVLTNETPAAWTLNGVFTRAFGKPAAPTTANANGALPKVLVSQLFIADVRNKSVRQLTTDDSVYFEPAWSADGRSIVCASSEGRDPWVGPLNLYAIDAENGAKKALTDGVGDKRMPTWSPDGKRIAYVGGNHSQMSSVFVIPAGGGAAVNVAAKLQRYVNAFEWLPDSQSLAVQTWDAVNWPILSVRTADGSVEKLTSGAAMRQVFSVARNGDMVWTQSDGSHHAVVWKRPGRGGKVSEIFDANPQIRDWTLGKQEVIEWKNARGEALEGVLLKPVGYQAGKRYPLIVDGYQAQPNAFKASAMMGNQVWAARGYAVFWPAARAPHTWMAPYRDQAFDDAAQGPRGVDVLVDDVMSGVDEVIRRGVADPQRMGLHGFSNGGGVVGYLVTRTNRFRCAVWASGVYPDWILPALIQTDSTLSIFEGGADVWDEPETYVKLSAVYHLKNVTTPMLLAVGDDDGFFFLGGIELFNSLRALKKDVTLLRYANQGHGFSGMALKDFSERELRFFDRYLK